MIGEIVRKLGFWTLDFIKKGQILKPYNDIEKIIGGRYSSEKQIDEYLYKLLEHAVHTTKYYEKCKGYKELSDFPVVKKKDIKANYEQFLSNKYKKNNLIRVQTSGSYGTPFIFYITKEKKARQTAEIIYFSKWGRYNLGMKHAYLRGVINKSKLKLKIQNEYFLFSRIIDDEWMKSCREVIKKRKIKVLIGFPTAISMVAQYCHEQGDTPKDFAIIGVITSSEPLLDSQRNIIESTFGCDCLSRYSTEELGVLAHECPMLKKHHINTASYKVEVLSLDKDEPSEEGEVGRIVVTDLFSYAMPSIRYETGDLGVLGKKCLCGLEGPIIESLHGRTVESVYNTSGKRILPFFIEDVMESFVDIVQYQFIQYGKKNYKLKVVAPKNFEFDENRVIDHIKFWMGEDAVVNIEFVEDIQTLKSGKRPYVINNYIIES